MRSKCKHESRVLSITVMMILSLLVIKCADVRRSYTQIDEQVESPEHFESDHIVDVEVEIDQADIVDIPTIEDEDNDDNSSYIEETPTHLASTEEGPVTETAAESHRQVGVLTAIKGVNYNAMGYKETWYNLDMTGVIHIMRNAGFSESEFPYWVREDGVKMFGPYVMVAADLSLHPRGSTVETSLGTGIVCDTGEFIYQTPHQFDIAVSWQKQNRYR